MFKRTLTICLLALALTTGLALTASAAEADSADTAMGVEIEPGG